MIQLLISGFFAHFVSHHVVHVLFYLDEDDIGGGGSGRRGRSTAVRS